MKDRLTPRVLVVGPAASQGGIAAVLRIHRMMRLWTLANCRMLSTYSERNKVMKIFAMLTAYMFAPFLIFRSSLVHIHVAAQHSMFRKLPIALLAKFMRKPYILHLHAASTHSLFVLTPQWLVRMLFLLSYRVIVLSDSWADVVKAHVPDARVTVIRNPVQSLQPIDERAGSGCMILFAGKLESRKGYKELLQAAPKVLRQFPKVMFCLAGHGEIEEARVEAQRLGIEASVSFLGWLSSEEMERYFQKASIFCLPSFEEGLPMSVLEAMNHGLPVVCTPVGGLPGLISDGQDALFVEPGNVDSIAHGLITLLSDPEHAKQIGRRAALTVQRECGLEQIESELSSLYDDVITEWIVRRRGIPETTRSTHDAAR